MTKAMGHVADVFNAPVLAKLPGPMAIGHVRYSTAGESRLSNAQPFLIDCAHGQIAIAHNGNLVNADELRDELERDGSIFQTTSDTEVILHLFARSRAAHRPSRPSIESVAQVRGAYSLVMLTQDRLIAVRDPHGFRPLALGKLGDAWVVCSETCALDLIGATYVRDVEPGEVVVISPDGMKSFRPFADRSWRTASSSTSTSRGPTATCSARASTRCAPTSAACSRARRRSTPTSSCRCPTPACAPRSASPRSRASRCGWA